MEKEIDGLLNRVPVKDQDIIFRKVGDEYILVPMLSSSDEVEHIYNLNQVGADIWERIDGEKTVKMIIWELVETYEGDPAQIETDVLDFIQDIHSAGIISFIDEGD